MVASGGESSVVKPLTSAKKLMSGGGGGSAEGSAAAASVGLSKVLVVTSLHNSSDLDKHHIVEQEQGRRGTIIYHYVYRVIRHMLIITL